MLKKYQKSKVICQNCQQFFYFHSYDSLTYYYTKQGKKRPSSDFYQLYCQPPFPNYQDGIYIHCRKCLVYFKHNVWTDEEGRQNNGAIYIDLNGLCLECRNNAKHLDHACRFSQTSRVWGTIKHWESLFTSSTLPGNQQRLWQNFKSSVSEQRGKYA